MSLPQLPAELLDAICQLVQPLDLAALARTNSTIHPIAQRLLYRHLSVSSTSHDLQVVVALAKQPELAQHVRTFTLRLDSSTVFSSFYRLLGVALSGMTELTSLDLFVDSTASWILSEIQCTYPRLVHFGSSFALDNHVAAFLSKTEALLELEVDGASTTPNSLPAPTLPVASIPRLSQFVGSSHVASAIVPGRPVESIHLPSGDLTEEDVISLAKSTAHVVIFGATTSSLPMALLDSLSQRMPYLVYLRLMTTCNFSEPPKPSFYEQITTALTSLPDLKGFELGGMHWGPSQKQPKMSARYGNRSQWSVTSLVWMMWAWTQNYSLRTEHRTFKSIPSMHVPASPKPFRHTLTRHTYRLAAAAAVYRHTNLNVFIVKDTHLIAVLLTLPLSLTTRLERDENGILQCGICAFTNQETHDQGGQLLKCRKPNRNPFR
ncbi:hypothetical protein FPV67DRAFT_400982 [Lyophyllum atratum]|nr:hypothetical protein FPV67DRAFT_400982 [Lyophyllum atratum]